MTTTATMMGYLLGDTATSMTLRAGIGASVFLLAGRSSAGRVFPWMPASEPPPVDPVLIQIIPAYAQVAVAAGAQAGVRVTLQMTKAVDVLAVTVDCGCVKPLDPVPMHVPAGDTSLHLQATGVLPGIKTITVRTTAGSATAQIQVVTPGFGEGRQILADLIEGTAGSRLLVIIHDLHGETRNCGCSTGSLGGLVHLTA